MLRLKKNKLNVKGTDKLFLYEVFLENDSSYSRYSLKTEYKLISSN